MARGRIAVMLLLGAAACGPGPSEPCTSGPVASLEHLSGGEDVYTAAVLSAAASTDPCGGEMIYTWLFLEQPEGSGIGDAAWQGSGSTSADEQVVVFDVPGTWAIRVEVETLQGTDQDEVVVEVGGE